LGVAESYDGDDRSTLAGAVLAGDRLDGLVFGRCSVGGTDATDAVVGLWNRLARPDVRYVLLAGVAPAWYNLFDVRTLAERVDRPVLAVTFESPDEPLADALGRAFEGDALDRRLELAGRLPERLPVDGGPPFVRPAGCPVPEAREVVRTLSRDGRPEPLRAARLAARAADRLLGRATGI
jgi:endonuclease V-like protein UPF0215 family